MKRRNDGSDVPKARIGILPKIHTSSKRTTRLHSSRLQKSVFSEEPQQESWRRASLRLISERVYTWSARKTSNLPTRKPSGPLGKSDDGVNSQRRGANQRRGNSVCQAIGRVRQLVRHCYASSRNSRSAVIGETLRRTWIHVSLEKRSETTSH